MQRNGLVDGFAKSIETINSSTGCDRVLLYVHGYNTTFRSALLRAGQLAHDAEWPCAAAAFSWGSEGQFDRYVADIERSSYAVPLLMGVLKGLKARHVTPNIVAHSMGNRVTLSALSGLSGSCDPDHPVIDELILAAPDVGAEQYNDDFGTLLSRALRCVHRVTIYASRNDMVLMLSDSLHGGIPRAGLEPQSDVRYARDNRNVDVIDDADAPAIRSGTDISSCPMKCSTTFRWCCTAPTLRAALARRARFVVRTRTTRPARDRRITTRSWYRRRANSAGPHGSSGTSSPSSSRSNTAFPDS